MVREATEFFGGEEEEETQPVNTFAVNQIGPTLPQPITGTKFSFQEQVGPIVQEPIAPTPQVAFQPQNFPDSSIVGTVLQKTDTFLTETAKFGARAGVAFVDLVSEGADFTADFVANQIADSLQPKVGIGDINFLPEKESKILSNKWIQFYNQPSVQEKLPTTKFKSAVDRLQEIEFIQPSQEWVQAPLHEKLTTRLGETLLTLGPSVVSSIGAFAINPTFGLATIVTATANDVKDNAIAHGVDDRKAELLGLSTGILVGALERIVPNKLFTSNGIKNKFIGSFAKRVAETSLLEAGTEMTQEAVQLIAERTFREDLGWDEVATRVALSGLGGLLGGSGVQTVVSLANDVQRNEILGGLKNVQAGLSIKEVTEVGEVGEIEKKTRENEFGKNVEFVPVEELLPFREFERIEDKRFKELREQISKEGIKEPILLNFDVNSKQLVVAEGNRRLQIAQELGLKNVPVKVLRINVEFLTQEELLKIPGTEIVDEDRVRLRTGDIRFVSKSVAPGEAPTTERGDVLSEFKPSQIGLTVAEALKAKVEPTPKRELVKVRGEEFELVGVPTPKGPKPVTRLKIELQRSQFEVKQRKIRNDIKQVKETERQKAKEVQTEIKKNKDNKLKEYKENLANRQQEAIKILDTLPKEHQGRMKQAIKDATTDLRVDRLRARVENRIAKLEEQEAIRDSKGLLNLSKTAKITPEYQRLIKGVADAYDFKRPTDKTISRLRATREFLERNPDYPIPHKYIEELKRLEQKSLRDLSTEDIKEFNQTIRNLSRIGKEIQKHRVLVNKLKFENELEKATVSVNNLDTKSKTLNQAIKADNAFQFTFRVGDKTDGSQLYEGWHAQLTKELAKKTNVAEIDQANRMFAFWQEHAEVDPLTLSKESQKRVAAHL